MTNKTHLDELLDDNAASLGKKLIAESIALVRYPEAATTSYPVKLRAISDEQLHGAAG